MAQSEIKMKMSLDSSGVTKTLGRMKSGIANFAKNGIAQLGALAAAAGLGSLARSAIDLGSKISDLAVQLNIGTTELQTLEFASREAGVATEVMARALRNVQTRTEEAIKGNKSYGDAFKQLGIDVNEFKKLSVEKRLEAIAIAQSKATDSGAAYNSVARILGEKAGPALQEVLQKLASEGYGSLEKAAVDAGEVMDKDTIAKMDKAADTIESFKRKITVLTAKILTYFMPGLKMLSNGLGFIGDVLGITASSMLAFGNAMGTVMMATIAPAISQMEALGMAIKSAGQFAKGDFSGAKESITSAKAAAKEIIGEVKSIPKAIGKAFNDLKTQQDSAWQTLGESIDKRADLINSALKDITGSAKEAGKAVSDVSGDSGGGAGGGGGGGGVNTSKPTEGGAMGLDIERGEFETRKAFLKRREDARKGHLQLNEAKRQIAAGSEAWTPDKIQALQMQAQGKKTSDNPLLAVTTTMNESIQRIEKELVQ